MQCPTCNVVFKSYTAVSLHFRNKHGTSQQFAEIMRLKLVEERYNGVVPTCKCGCNGTPKYYDYDRGYVEFIRGHQSRVNNNWGHNKTALAKSQDKRREQIVAGEWVAWNKGETKETDERIEAYGDKGRVTIMSNPLERKARSEKMTADRLNGTIRTLYGKEHSQWRGGVSSVQSLSRSYVFNVWTYPKLLASGFTCQSCGSKSDLCVHHDKERFAQILQKAREMLGDVTEDFATHQAYAKWVANYHVQNDISGIVLCEKCHDCEHAAK